MHMDGCPDPCTSVCSDLVEQRTGPKPREVDPKRVILGGGGGSGTHDLGCLQMYNVYMHGCIKWLCSVSFKN